MAQSIIQRTKSLKSRINGVAKHDFKYKRYGNPIYNND